MSFAVGVYDLFAYSIPGAVYLAIAGYVARRAGWYDVTTFDIASLPGLLVFIVAAYLTGQLVYRPTQTVGRRIRGRGRTSRAARDQFRAENTSVASRPFVDADIFLLLPAVQKHNPDAAADIGKFRASGIMLRATSPAFALGAVIAVVEVVLGHHPRLGAVTAASVLAGSSLLAFEGERRYRVWAIKTTLQAACWIPGVDEVVSGAPPTA